MKKLPAVLTALALLSLADSAQAAVYDATSGFSITNSNPNGVWTYGWMPSDFSGFSVFTATVDGSLFNQWYLQGVSSDNTPNISFNDTLSVNHQVMVNQLTLHPGPGGQVAALRFTAPFEGAYDIMGQFLAGDSGTMQVGIRQDSTWLFQQSDQGTFALDDYHLAANATLDFVVYGGYAYGNTPLDLVISSPTAPVPLPGTCLLFGTGLAGLAGVRLKRTKT